MCLTSELPLRPDTARTPRAVRILSKATYPRRFRHRVLEARQTLGLGC